MADASFQQLCVFAHQAFDQVGPDTSAVLRALESRCCDAGVNASEGRLISVVDAVRIARGVRRVPAPRPCPSSDRRPSHQALPPTEAELEAERERYRRAMSEVREVLARRAMPELGRRHTADELRVALSRARSWNE